MAAELRCRHNEKTNVDATKSCKKLITKPFEHLEQLAHSDLPALLLLKERRYKGSKLLGGSAGGAVATQSPAGACHLMTVPGFAPLLAIRSPKHDAVQGQEGLSQTAQQAQIKIIQAATRSGRGSNDIPQ